MNCLYARYLCSRACVQETFARARTRTSVSATIGFLVYNLRAHSARPSVRDDRVSCIQMNCKVKIISRHAQSKEVKAF